MIMGPQSSKFNPVTPLPNRAEKLFTLGKIAVGIPLEAIADEQRSELLALLTAVGHTT